MSGICNYRQRLQRAIYSAPQLTPRRRLQSAARPMAGACAKTTDTGARSRGKKEGRKGEGGEVARPVARAARPSFKSVSMLSSAAFFAVNGAATEASALAVSERPTSAALSAAVSLAPSPTKAVT